MLNKIQNSVGVGCLIIFLIIAAILASFGIVNLFVYWISLLFAGSVFAFDWSLKIGTGFWLLFLLISMACNSQIKIKQK